MAVFEKQIDPLQPRKKKLKEEELLAKLD